MLYWRVDFRNECCAKYSLQDLFPICARILVFYYSWNRQYFSVLCRIILDCNSAHYVYYENRFVKV
jgi:hypothetical protein